MDFYAFNCQLVKLQRYFFINIPVKRLTIFLQFSNSGVTLMEVNKPGHQESLNLSTGLRFFIYLWAVLDKLYYSDQQLSKCAHLQ